MRRFVCLALLVGSFGCSSGEIGRSDVKRQFSMPNQCGACHPTQFREWQGSVMHYAAVSPVFRAFELTMRKLSTGLFAANGDAPNFASVATRPPAI